MRSVAAAVLVALLLLGASWRLVRGMDGRLQEVDRTAQALDDLSLAQSSLERDVLRARAGILRDYDPVVRHGRAIREAAARLGASPPLQEPGAALALDRLRAALGEQALLVERFKSDNALLQSSLRHFALLADRIDAGDDPAFLIAEAKEAALAILALTLDSSAEQARRARARLDALASARAAAADVQGVRILLSHGRLLTDLLPAVDAALQASLRAGGGEAQAALRDQLQARRAGLEADARAARRLLLASSALLLLLLAHAGWRLRARARALRDRAALEQLVAGVSAGLAPAEPEAMDARIAGALEALARHVGADRAYLLERGSETAHLWAADGRAPARGWPVAAGGLPGLLPVGPGGVVQVADVRRLPPGPVRDRLQAASVRAWIGVPTEDGGKEALLGLDLLHGPLRALPQDLAILRVAADAIGHARGRERLLEERRRLEQELERARRMETLGAFASGIAHNFNNLVGGILGHAEMLEDRLGAGTAQGSVRAIREAGRRGQALVDSILAFGRPQPAWRRPVDLGPLLQETAALLRASLPKGVLLELRLPPGPATVSGDPAQLQQVVLNLAANAAQATGGRGRIGIEASLPTAAPPLVSHGELGRGPHLRIAVSDDGRGMDEATRARLFEPFFTTRSDGHGLGLATVGLIVRAHGGAIHVRSRPGQGSRFEVWLPTAPDQAPSSTEAPRSAQGEGEVVLLLEGERRQLLRGEELLAALAYEPAGFASAEAALQACREAPARFDAVILGASGGDAAPLALAARFRAVAPGRPILLASASAGRLGAASLAQAGVAAVLPRPLEPGATAHALARCLAATRATAAPAAAEPQVSSVTNKAAIDISA